MAEASPPLLSVPRIEFLRVRNFRVLQDIELRDLTTLTVLIGANGSGKTTLFDVLAFLQEAFLASLETAVESRFGMRELRTREETGPIEIQIQIRFSDDALLHYEIAFDEQGGRIVVLWERATVLEMDGVPIQEGVASLARAEGWTYDAGGTQVPVSLQNPGELAVPLLGRVGTNNWFVELREFVAGWYLSDIDATDVRRIPEAGPQSRLSRTGGNVANVLEWISERHPDRLPTIRAGLRKRVPQLESIEPITTGDGRSMLQLKDVPFARAIPARNASEGTLRLLAYLTALYGVEPLALMGFEEPEANLPPQLLNGLGEEFRIASAHSQILVNTHSSIFLDALRPKEVWLLHRNEEGHTRTQRVAEIPGIAEMVDAGAILGDLWTEGFFDASPLQGKVKTKDTSVE